MLHLLLLTTTTTTTFPQRKLATVGLLLAGLLRTGLGALGRRAVGASDDLQSFFVFASWLAGYKMV